MTTVPTLGVGMVGHAFMGTAHSQAWRNAHRFFELPREPRMVALAGRDPEAAQAAATRLGWERAESDWRRLLDDPEIDLIDICTPGDTHREIAVAALAAGKHVLCEKPLANTVAQAQEMAEAARRASAQGIRSMCGFSYRRTPALALAKRFVDQGRLGEVRQVRGQYLQDWLSDENAPLTWRLQKDRAGSGALGDIGAHLIDTAQWLTGDTITGVSALLKTFVTSRPIAGSRVGLGGQGLTGDTERGPVTVDDAAYFQAEFGRGATGTFEATRFALGRKNAMRVELNGSAGSLAFDFEESNVLEYFDGSDPEDARGFRRIIVTEPSHPYVGNWWPAGHGLGYEHGFVHQVVDLVTSIGAGRDPRPSFADGLQVQQVLDAVERSAAGRSVWSPVGA